MFNKRVAELGEPKKLLFVAKLAKPVFSDGMRRRIITIKKTFNINSRSSNIDFHSFEIK